MRVGKYELGKTLGEGNFGKVKLAVDLRSGRRYAVKILDKTKILHLNFSDQVLASKTKIYMVMECVTGGELFDRIESKGKLDEAEGRRLFQQLFDGLSYCHDKGVYHRDLKLENVLVDDKGNIKISDFGLSALPQNCREDGLLHTTCGSPNYVAPEVLANRGYNGAASDIWSCGVILYVILTACLPFDETNLALLYKKDVSERKTRFTSNHSAKDLLERIEIIATDMGFRVQKKSGKLKVMQEIRNQRSLSNLSFKAEVFEISPLLNVVELKKSFGDSSAYRQLCERLSNDLGTNPELERHNSSSFTLNSAC